MKKVFLAIICLFLLTNETYADVSINGTNFPDSTFRAYVSENFDKNNDGILSDEEINSVTTINVQHTGVTSLTGIAYFSSLRILRCGYTDITELDMSNCEALTMLYCDATYNLTTLNVRGCKNLTNLFCGNTSSLTNLDVSNCTALSILDCHNGRITTLNVSGCTALDNIHCSNNNLTALDVSSCIKLVNLDCYINNLSLLNVNNCTALLSLNCHDNRLTNLDVSDCTALNELYCYKNSLARLDVTKCLKLSCVVHDKRVELDVNVSNIDPSIRPLLKKGKVGVEYNIELRSSRSNSKVLWQEFDGLPDGLTQNASSITGIPTEKGKFIISATNDDGTSYETFIFLLEIEATDALPDSNSDKSSLSATVLEHGRNDGLYSADGSGYTLYNAISNDNAYLDYKGEIVTEAKIAAINDKAYIKEGFTADGNTRLILRIQSSKPGYVSFDVPIALGARLETLEGRKELTSNSLLTTTQVINYVNPYASPNNQATAVLIAPRDYPSSMNFPSDTFDVKVRFSDGSNIAEMSIPLEIHATPVVLIHGLWGNGLANFGLQNKTGIHTKLKDAGFSVTYWDYDGTLGPTDVIKNIKNPLYSHIASVRKKMNRKRIACTRVDFVCHSMGGLMARQYTRSDLDTGNRSMHSYMSDSVRRIVTVATPHDGSPIANYLLEDFDELGLDRVDPFFAEVFKFARGAVKELVGKMNGDATAAFTDLAVNSKLLNELGYPKSVPMYSIYGTIKNHLEPLKETINGFADVANNVANAVVVYELVSGKYIWSHKSRLLLTGAVLVKCLAPHVSDIVESILSDIIFDGDDYDIAVPKSSALAHDKFLANSQLYDGWDDQHCYNHMEICVQDDVGDYVVELLKGPEDKFKIFDESGKSSSTANKKSVVKVSDTAEAILKERFQMSVTPSVISVSETETAETTLKATIQEGVVESVYVLLNGDRIFSLGSNDGGNTFETKLLFGSRDVGIYNVLCLSPSSESSKDILISNIAQIIVKPMLSNVASIVFPNELDSIATNVGAKINLGLCATTTDGRIYDISSPLMGTEWTSDDIAFVTDRGEVKGLKEGVTILKATYQGLTASISVDVGASYFDDNTTTPQDDDKEAQEQLNNEFNNTLNSSGAGCNGICYGVLACSLIFLFFNNKRENFG